MTTRELSSSPSMLLMFARAGVAMIPGASRLPFVAGGGRDVPDLTLRLTDVAVDPDRLSAYNRVCGFDLRDTVPVTYPHILAFPLQLSLMTDPSFPFPAIGLVHIANRIIQHRPIRISGGFRSRWGRRRSRTTPAASSSRCSRRCGWATSWSGRRSRPT